VNIENADNADAEDVAKSSKTTCTTQRRERNSVKRTPQSAAHAHSPVESKTTAKKKPVYEKKQYEKKSGGLVLCPCRCNSKEEKEGEKTNKLEEKEGEEEEKEEGGENGTEKNSGKSVDDSGSTGDLQVKQEKETICENLKKGDEEEGKNETEKNNSESVDISGSAGDSKVNGEKKKMDGNPKKKISTMSAQPNSNKPFQCGECSKTFTKHYYLQTHSRTHDDSLMRFHCSYCPAK
jgi:hypothetical protein